jgi:hypothetical protein
MHSLGRSTTQPRRRRIVRTNFTHRRTYNDLAQTPRTEAPLCVKLADIREGHESHADSRRAAEELEEQLAVVRSIRALTQRNARAQYARNGEPPSPKD